MIINNNVNALNAWRNLTITNSALGKSLEKLSSGLRINRAADDAAGLAISEKMRGQINGLDQARSNAQDAISLIQTAEGALNETHAMIQRIRTLAVKAATDTMTDDDRNRAQEEVDQLLAQIDNISTQTEFNTKALLDSTFSGQIFHIGANTGQAMTVTISGMHTSNLSIINLSINSQTAANSAIGLCNTAINVVSQLRSKLGAIQNRLEHAIKNLGVAHENLTASESRIRDTDMAKEMATFTKNQILIQAGTAMLAQANMNPQSVLKLLG